MPESSLPKRFDADTNGRLGGMLPLQFRALLEAVGLDFQQFSPNAPMAEKLQQLQDQLILTNKWAAFWAYVGVTYGLFPEQHVAIGKAGPPLQPVKADPPSSPIIENWTEISHGEEPLYWEAGSYLAFVRSKLRLWMHEDGARRLRALRRLADDRTNLLHFLEPHSMPRDREKHNLMPLVLRWDEWTALEFSTDGQPLANDPELEQRILRAVPTLSAKSRLVLTALFSILEKDDRRMLSLAIPVAEALEDTASSISRHNELTHEKSERSFLCIHQWPDNNKRTNADWNKLELLWRVFADHYDLYLISPDEVPQLDWNVVEHSMKAAVSRCRSLEIGEVHQFPLEAVYIQLDAVPYSTTDPAQAGLLAGQEEEDLMADLELSYGEAAIVRRQIQPPIALSGMGAEVSLDKLLCECQAMLILGDPGSGKSTIVQWLALQFGKAVLHCKGDQDFQRPLMIAQSEVAPTGSAHEQTSLGAKIRIPIVLRVADFANQYRRMAGTKTLPLIDCLGRSEIHCLIAGDSVSARLDEDNLNQQFQHVLRKGDGLVLIDGLDEVANADEVLPNGESMRKYVNGRISEFVNWAVPLKNQVVITSRKEGFVLLQTSCIHNFQILPIHGDMIQPFCHTLFKAMDKDIESASRKSKDLSSMISQKPYLKTFAQSPLLLTSLAVLYQAEGAHLPKERAELFECLIANVLRRASTRDDVKNADLDPSKLRRILEDIAQSMQERSSIGSLTRADIELLIHSSFYENVEPDPTSQPTGHQRRVRTKMTMQARAVTAALLSGGGLLKERSPNSFSFWHNSFREYLSASRLVNRPPNVCDAAANVRSCIQLERWRQINLLAVTIVAKSPDWPTASERWTKADAGAFFQDLMKADAATSHDPVGLALLLGEAAFEGARPPDCQLLAKSWDTLVAVLAGKQALCKPSYLAESKSLLTKLEASPFSSEVAAAFCRTLAAGREEHDSRALSQLAIYFLEQERGAWSPSICSEFMKAIEWDLAGIGFPIHELLRRTIQSQRPEAEIVSSLHLPLRQALLCDDKLVEKIIESPDLLRLVIALFGGIEDSGEAARLQRRHVSWAALNTGPDVYLTEEEEAFLADDARQIELLNFERRAPSFLPKNLYRPSPLAECLLKHFRTRDSVADLRGRWMRMLGGENETFLAKEIALAVHLLGSPWEDIPQAYHTYVLTQLQRVSKSIQRAIWQIDPCLHSKQKSTESGWSMLMTSLLELRASAEIAPCRITSSVGSQDGEMMSAEIEALVQSENLAWEWSGTNEEDALLGFISRLCSTDDQRAALKAQIMKKRHKQVYLVHGTDKGKKAWYYVCVKKSRIKRLEDYPSKVRIRLDEFGEVLECGWGESPPPDVAKKYE